MTETYLRGDAVKAILKETAPVCFHCGIPYEKDMKLCGMTHNTWMPGCECINKPTIRILTGGQIEFEVDDGDEDTFRGHTDN